MGPDELKIQLLEQLHHIQPNDWEIDQSVEQLEELPESEQYALIKYVSVIWPISHSLCFSFLEYGSRYIRNHGASSMSQWVRELLEKYEKEGLRSSRVFMEESVERGLCAGHSHAVHLEDVRRRLLPFIRGVSALPLELAPDRLAWTDSQTLYLPEMIDICPHSEDNHRLMMFFACCQWGYIATGTFRLPVAVPDDAIETVLQEYGQPETAHAVLHALEFSRMYWMLSQELPGLMRHVGELLPRLLVEKLTEGRDKENHFGELILELITQADLGSDLTMNGNGISLALSSRNVLDRYYKQMTESDGNHWQPYHELLGKLDFAKVRERVRLKREEERKKAITQLAKAALVLIDGEKNGDKNSEEQPGNHSSKEDGRVVIQLVDTEKKGTPKRMRVNNEMIELPQELNELLASIEADLGKVPESYMQAAAGLAGQGRVKGSTTGALTDRIVVKEGIQYDEWDYRRQGYRKGWCTLLEKTLLPVRSSFVDEARVRYRGTLSRLRRQFEALRTQHQFVRRRRYGDDIDCDALVDALADKAAGQPVSENLFVRLLRDTRDIGVLFLVDMSNSTEGWVGRAIKESLVLLTDVLDIAGDRYGIYGFSGMRRSRCELYRIKEIDEPTSPVVEQRIAAITPKEYTRMATPIRHLTKQLLRVEAKIRLLIVISDGKPEDYDDYNGEYAIEDTRQALHEARGKGIIPFCITVDRDPHDYLGHLFGQKNYIFINEIEKLPQRMPEIYRLLTS